MTELTGNAQVLQAVRIWFGGNLSEHDFIDFLD